MRKLIVILFFAIVALLVSLVAGCDMAKDYREEICVVRGNRPGSISVDLQGRPRSANLHVDAKPGDRVKVRYRVTPSGDALGKPRIEIFDIVSLDH